MRTPTIVLSLVILALLGMQLWMLQRIRRVEVEADWAQVSADTARHTLDKLCARAPALCEDD